MSRSPTSPTTTNANMASPSNRTPHPLVPPPLTISRFPMSSSSPKFALAPEPPQTPPPIPTKDEEGGSQLQTQQDLHKVDRLEGHPASASAPMALGGSGVVLMTAGHVRAISPPTPAPSPRPQQNHPARLSMISLDRGHTWMGNTHQNEGIDNLTPSSPKSPSLFPPEGEGDRGSVVPFSGVPQVDVPELLLHQFSLLPPQLRDQFLSSLIPSLTRTELREMNQVISPRLKRDFMKDLPTEVALHILGFIDDAKTMVRCGCVSKWWRELVSDEANWRAFCFRTGFGAFGDGISGNGGRIREESLYPTPAPLGGSTRGGTDGIGGGTVTMRPRLGSSGRPSPGIFHRNLDGGVESVTARQDPWNRVTVFAGGATSATGRRSSHRYALGGRGRAPGTGRNAIVAANRIDDQPAGSTSSSASSSDGNTASRGIFSNPDVANVPETFRFGRDHWNGDVTRPVTSSSSSSPTSTSISSSSLAGLGFRGGSSDSSTSDDLQARQQPPPPPASTRGPVGMGIMGADVASGMGIHVDDLDSLEPLSSDWTQGSNRQPSNSSSTSSAMTTSTSSSGRFPSSDGLYRDYSSDVLEVEESLGGLRVDEDNRSQGLATPRPADAASFAWPAGPAEGPEDAREDGSEFTDLGEEAISPKSHPSGSGPPRQRQRQGSNSAPRARPVSLPLPHQGQDELSTSERVQDSASSPFAERSNSLNNRAGVGRDHAHTSQSTAKISSNGKGKLVETGAEDGGEARDASKPAPFSYKQHFKRAYLTQSNWLRGPGKVLSSQTSADDGVITSLGFDDEWIVVGISTSKILVFDAKTGQYYKTLRGHDQGVWALTLVSKGGEKKEPPARDTISEADAAKEAKAKKKPRSSEPQKAKDRGGQTQTSSSAFGNAGPSRTSGRRSEGSSSSSSHAAHEASPHDYSTQPPPSPRFRSTSRFASNVISPPAGHARTQTSPPRGQSFQYASTERNRRSSFSSTSSSIGLEDPLPSLSSSASSAANAAAAAARLGNVCGTATGWGNEGAMIVSGGCDRDVRVWDVATGSCRFVLRGHTSTIRCLKVLHNRPIAVSGARDSTIRVWDIEKGKQKHLLTGHEQSVRCLEVWGNKVASGSYDTTCRLWNVDTGECLHVFVGHFHQLYAVAFDGIRIATGSLDSTVRIWSAETGECLALLQGHTSLVGQIQMDPANNVLVTGGSDGRVIVYNLETYACIHRLCAHDNSVTCLQFDDRFVITGGNDGRVKLWDYRNGRFIRELTPPCESVWRVTFRDDTCVVLCKRGERTVMDVITFTPDESEL